MKKEEKALAFLYVALGVSALIAATAILLGTWNIGEALAAEWFSFTFQSLHFVAQIILTLLGSILAGWIVWQALSGAVTSVNERMLMLEKKYDTEFSKLRRRRPVILSAFLLISEGAVLISDKVFPGHTLKTVLIGLLLLLLFWLSFYAIGDSSRMIRVLGYALYCFALLSLPLAIMLHHKWNVAAVRSWILDLPPETRVITVLVFGIFVGLPIVVSRIDVQESERSD